MQWQAIRIDSCTFEQRVKIDLAWLPSFQHGLGGDEQHHVCVCGGSFERGTPIQPGCSCDWRTIGH